MPKWPVTSILILILLPALAGCGPTGPPSTETSSTSIPALADRIQFLQTYLTFDRQYEQLEFNIYMQNNSGGFVPGPSDWDVKLVAKVPPNELSLWAKGLKSSPEDNVQWLTEVAQEIDVSGVDFWFREGGKVVGIDQKNSIVAYRLNTLGH